MSAQPSKPCRRARSSRPAVIRATWTATSAEPVVVCGRSSLRSRVRMRSCPGLIKVLVAWLSLSRIINATDSSTLRFVTSGRSAARLRCSARLISPLRAWQFTARHTAILKAEPHCTTSSGCQATVRPSARSPTTTAPSRPIASSAPPNPPFTRRRVAQEQIAYVCLPAAALPGTAFTRRRSRRWSVAARALRHRGAISVAHPGVALSTLRARQDPVKAGRRGNQMHQRSARLVSEAGKGLEPSPWLTKSSRGGWWLSREQSAPRY